MYNPTKSLSEAAPIFADLSLPSSETGSAIFQAVQSRYDYDQVSAELEEAYRNGTLTADVALDLFDRSWISPDIIERLYSSMGVLIQQYETEYAYAHWHMKADPNNSNDTNHTNYLCDFHRKDVTGSPFKQVFVMEKQDLVNKYYMVPASVGKNSNPRSWILYGFNAGTTNGDGDGDGIYDYERSSDVPNYDDVSKIDNTDPRGDFSTVDRYNKWVIIDRQYNIDLSSMIPDEQGRIHFEALQPYTDCTHLMLVIDDVWGTNAQGQKEMYLSNFYYHKSEPYNFVASKTTVTVDEHPGYIEFTSDLGSSDWKLQEGGMIYLHHKESDVKNIDDVEWPLTIDDSGTLRYDIAQWTTSYNDNDKFPFKIGYWCDAILRYKVKNTNTDEVREVELTFPVHATAGKPIPYLGVDGAGDYMIDNVKEDAVVSYPIEIENLDPALGFYINVVVKDYTSGRLADKQFTYLARPGDIDLFDASGTELSWIRFEQSNWGHTESEKIAHNQTVRALIHVPVNTIPMSDDAKVSVTTMNGYGEFMSTDIHKNLENQYVQFESTVYNNAFTPDLLRGTYTVGAKYKSEARDIKDWQSDTEQHAKQLRTAILENLENPVMVDSLIDVERGRTMMSFTFEYPSAWGDVRMYMATPTSRRNVPGITYKDEYGERVVSQSTFSRTVEFPRDSVEHNFVLSWQEGKFEYKFPFTSYNNVVSDLYLYMPVVNDDTEDHVHPVTISYGKIVNGGMVNKKRFERSGHFSATTKYRDNKIYIYDPELSSTDVNAGPNVLYKFNCTLASNKFVSTFNNRFTEVHDGATWHMGHIITPMRFDNRKYGLHTTNDADVPMANLIQHPIRFDLRSQGQYARFSLVNEKGEALNNGRIRYTYAEQTKDGLVFDNQGEVDNYSGENIYLVPVATSEDTEYKLFIEASTTDRTADNKPYMARLFCEKLDGADFTEHFETGDVYTCVLGRKKSGEGDFYVHDLWVRDTTYTALTGQGSRFNPNLSNVMPYAGCDSLRIDVLLSSQPQIQEPDLYLMAPLMKGVNYYMPFDSYKKVMDRPTDQQGHPIRWNAEQTGFTRDYQLLSTKTMLLQPAKKDNEEEPEIYDLLVWKGHKILNNKDSLITAVVTDKFGRNGIACAPAIPAQNYAKDNSNEVSKKAQESLDMEMPEMRFGRDMGFPSAIMTAFARLPLNAPNSYPFSMMISYEEDHFNLRGCFEVNGMDALPGYAAYKASNKFLTNVNKVQEEYNRVKNAIEPQKRIADCELPTLPTAFVGFKGFFDCGLYWDKKDSVYRPFFNDLVCRYEASANVRAILPFAGVGSINFGLDAVSYAQFMVSNPSPKDPYLEGRNYLSHFNVYGMIGASIDVKAAVQVGFDIGIAAACAGIRGAAYASIDACASTRPWLASGEDGKRSHGLRLAASASMSAFAKARFLFIEKHWEHEFFNTGLKVLYVPDTDKNPYKSDPNLAFKQDDKTQTYLRRAGSMYRVRHAAPRYRASEMLSGIDAFSMPTYVGHDGAIAFFNLNSPDSFMDDRLMLRHGSTQTTVDEESQKPVAAFSAATASGKDVSILALQCMSGLDDSFDDSDVSEENQQEAAQKTQIVAIVNDGHGIGNAKIISQRGKVHLAPKAGIDANGMAAIAWPSGDMKFVETADGSTNGIVEGDFNLSTYDGKTWSDPVSLTHLGEGTQISDYAVAVSGGSPVVLATIPGYDGQAGSPVYAITYQATKTGGSTMFQSLGFQGNSHQVVSLQDGRFVAATKVDADSIGADIMLYEGNVKNGELTIKNLGRLGLNQRDITVFKIVTPKGGTNNINDLSIVWNQHETQLLDAQENQATASNSCYAARITTDESLSISEPVRIYELTDDDNVASIDAYSSGKDEITSLICVTGAGANASTGAYVLQSDVKLTNQLKSYGVRLDGNLAKGEDARIELTVQNAGIDPITSLTAKVGDIVTTRNVTLKPGELGVISVTLPSGTNFNNDIPYSVDAQFVNTQDASKTETNGFTDAFHIELADLSAKLLTNSIDSIAGVVNVLASIKDRTICDLNDQYTIKVGLYMDPNGQNLYPGTSVMDVTPSQFRMSGTSVRKPVLACFALKTYENVDPRAYLIVNTVCPDGTVVKDQNNSDNSIMISLDKTFEKSQEEADGIDVLTIEDFENAKLVVKNNADGITIDNIDPTRDVKVYGPSGQLIRWCKAPEGSLTIDNMPRGILLIANGTRAGKILH